MECVIVHDLSLNETANNEHVFLPGSTFLEKDGIFTNAERRIDRVRKVMAPRNGYADWEVTRLLASAMGAGRHYTHPSRIMDEIAAATPRFASVQRNAQGKGGLAVMRMDFEQVGLAPVQVSPSNDPTNWQEDYNAQANLARRMLPAAE